MSIFDRYSHPDIHPDDLRAAINARSKYALADSKRHGRNTVTVEEVERDMFIAFLAESEMQTWPEWLRRDVIDYAADRNDPEFLVRLGKALMSGVGRSRWFDGMDIFILKNWRWGHEFQNKTRSEAITILRQHLSYPKWLVDDDTLVEIRYGKRIMRLGLTSAAAAATAATK